MSWQNFRAKAFLLGVRRSHPGRFLAAAALAAAAPGALQAPLAHAAIVPVRCSVPDLVEAINTANSSPDADTIRLAHTCTYKLVAGDPGNPANGLPAITSDITIEGHGATIARARFAPEFRILLVDRTGNLTLNKATISGGRAIDCPAFPDPPGQVCGGGINNQGTMAVNHSRVIDNTATSQVFAQGGGIDSSGTATVNNTEVSGNTAGYTGTDPGAAAGAGIANDGPLTVNNSRFTHNTVRVPADTDSIAFGSAHVGFAVTTIRDTLISHNHLIAPGGTARGTLAAAAPAPGTTVIDTVIRDNTAAAPEGTAAGAGAAANFPLSMTRTRIVGNRATAPDGGTALASGIQVGPSGQVTLSDSTVLRNAAGTSGGGSALGGGIGNAFGGTLTADESEISENTVRASDGGTARGGGVYNAVGSTTLNKSTVTGNRAGDGGGIFEESGEVTLNDTVVRRNQPNNCAPPDTVPGCIG